MKTATTRNFHVPSPTAVVSLNEEIARYAAEAAGTSDDLDELLETAGVERLNRSERSC